MPSSPADCHHHEVGRRFQAFPASCGQAPAGYTCAMGEIAARPMVVCRRKRLYTLSHSTGIRCGKKVLHVRSAGNRLRHCELGPDMSWRYKDVCFEQIREGTCRKRAQEETMWAIWERGIRRFLDSVQPECDSLPVARSSNPRIQSRSRTTLRPQESRCSRERLL